MRLGFKSLACGLRACLMIAGMLAVTGCAGTAARLPGFADDDDLRAFLRDEGAYEPTDGADVGDVPPPLPPPPSPSPSSPAGPDLADTIVMTASRAGGDASITNNQVAGVDEGGIVKVSGDYLVVLRRGRLFTVSTAGGALTPVDRIDVIPPGMETSDAWYDEMLIHGRTIVVLGYSYEMDATELSRFALSADGRLSHVDTHHLRSDDYYSARNYATRIVGDTLILYTPLDTCCSRDDPLDVLPGLSRWQPGQSEPVFTRLAGARDVHVPEALKAQGLGWVDTLHSVTRCDLSAAELDCRSSVVLGPQGRNFHVAQDAVFVWVAPR